MNKIEGAKRWYGSKLRTKIIVGILPLLKGIYNKTEIEAIGFQVYCQRSNRGAWAYKDMRNFSYRFPDEWLKAIDALPFDKAGLLNIRRSTIELNITLLKEYGVRCALKHTEVSQ